MSLLAYRVCRASYARLDGAGAWRVGGRWNSPGRRAVYLADSIALAVLENLVHMTREDFPSGYVVVSAEIPDTLEVLTSDLVFDAASRNHARSQSIGDDRFDRRLSAAMRVPSAAVSGAWNYLLNPEHPEFPRIVVARPVAFEFDPRLFA